MSEHQLATNVDELFDLVRKNQGIISTHSAVDIEESAESVENKYRTYAETHISLGDTSGFEQDIYGSVIEDEDPTKGYLYGPFGYGKTSTAVSIWDTLNENDIIAVPPFSITSFSAIMRATYGWMRHEFSNKAPSYVDQLEEIREEYLQEELQAYARRQEDDYDLEFDKLVEMFEEMEQQGDLDLSINADTLVDFFSECTELAQDADFDGLVVIGDELQQYFKSADNRQDAESRLRELVFGLHSGARIQNNFGFFVTMPDQTRATLETQAGDILNRLESDNLYRNLKNVYGQSFPRDLWDRYATRFNFEDQQYEVISEHALTATGQICSRDDLSNGPRTVIDIFRIALQQHDNSGGEFTALDLADAFYNGDVRYQGNATIIQSAINDALDHSAVDTGPKEQFIKLCAIFPQEGISDAVVEDYTLSDPRRELSKKLHGDLIKVVADGYALIDVTDPDGPQDIVRELIRDFWNQYDTGHVNAEYAMEALANKLVCGKLFESTRGELRGWATGGDLDQVNGRAYQSHRIKGTFKTKYPERLATIGVADVECGDEIVGRASTGVDPNRMDIVFNFILGWEKGGDDAVDPHIRRDSEREFTFVLNGRRTFDELPDGIEFLRDAMDPNAVTPFLMLALVQFLEDTDTELDASEEQRVESFQQSLLDQALKTLFNDALISNAPFEIQRAGKRAIENIFTKVMQELYPDYSTLISSAHYYEMMNDYNDFLDSLATTSLKRGSDTLEESKGQVASRFNLQQTSSFDGRIKKHYSDLLTVVNPDANDYEIKAELHPFEEFIVSKLESGEREELALEEVREIGYEKGYRQEELELIFSFLSRRGIVTSTNEQTLVLMETDYTIGEVESLIEECRELRDTIEDLDEDKIPEGATTSIFEIETHLEDTNPEDGERLEVLYVNTQGIIDELEQQAKILHSQYQQACKDLKTQVERQARSAVPDHLEDTIEGGVQFVGGLNDARSELLAQFRDLKERLKELSGELEDSLNEYQAGTLENASALNEQNEQAEAELEEIEEEYEELEKKADSLKDWKRFTSRVASVKNDIMGYSRTFDESVDEEDEITDFIGQVAERLADEPIAALDNLEGFEENLDRIQETYKHRREERQKVFQEKRETLKDILQEATGGTATGLRTASFNIQNPEESRRQLLEEFKDAYESQVLDQATNHLEDARREVEYAKIVGIETTVDQDPDRVDEEIQSAEATLNDLRSDLSQFEFDDIGDETTLGNQGHELLSTAEDLSADAMAFREEHDPEDDQVAETLDRIQDHRKVDFKDLLMEYHDDGETVDPEELLDRVQRLFVLNQIDIEISQRRGR